MLRVRHHVSGELCQKGRKHIKWTEPDARPKASPTSCLTLGKSLLPQFPLWGEFTPGAFHLPVELGAGELFICCCLQPAALPRVAAPSRVPGGGQRSGCGAALG